MKRIGLLGGLGPEATLDYYREIINAFKSRDSSLNYPEIIIYSVNMAEFLVMMNKKDYEKVIDYLLQKIENMRKGGADFAAISANTPHLVFDRLKKRSTLPLVSIVEAVCDEAIRLGFKRPALLGTGFTMSGTFYQEVFNRNDIDLIIPDEEDRKVINEKLFTEIELGIFTKETRDLFVGIIQKMKQQRKIDSVILGCTEFPLLLTENEYAGLPMLNTTKIHVDAIADYCLKN
jgi:aspartate racemase